jgi:hypothetical protein
MGQTGRKWTAAPSLWLAPSLLLLPLCLAGAASAQDSGHVRVDLGRQTSWVDSSPHSGVLPPLPAGPAPTNYAAPSQAQAYAHQERLRLKPMSVFGN